MSTESDNLVLKVKSYNVKTGFVKKVSVTLELVDILQAKMKFYKYARVPLPSPRHRRHIVTAPRCHR